ncbi:thiol-disulfide oxidoreductase DCC family protein [Synechococcus sp. RSCCF101]|uniref:thiol-disulfide oxidoreductase DCC family protein n=1 Tax=Synechococcus sp. RSCCF101 TaxID=2511069 RepID=UPI00351A72D5
MRWLERRDGGRGRLCFVDIAAPSYRPEDHAGITYRQAMATIHGIGADGEVLSGLAVFRRAYQLVERGWIYAPSTWPLLRGLCDRLYSLWAGWRLRLTGRPSLDQLCDERCRIPS